MSKLAYRLALVLLVALGLSLAASACGSSKDLILATTTSTQDSGLLDVLVPLFEKQSGYNVKVIAVGTGQALVMGQRGDADVLLVHAPRAEEDFMAQGYGINRQLVMHNDFVIVGPANDPADVKASRSAEEALTRLAQRGSLFISRGDDSGTNKLELEMWKQAKVNPKGQSWYQETGQGMGQTLTIASEKGGYTITDRATYLALQHNLRLSILLENDPALLNIYHVMQVNPEKHKNINSEGAKAFVEFMISPEAQRAIGDFGKEKFGQSLFIPDAGKDEQALTNR